MPNENDWTPRDRSSALRAKTLADTTGTCRVRPARVRKNVQFMANLRYPAKNDNVLAGEGR